MKFIVLSLALTACTSSAPVKEAPQKSPYTVTPCACMKIYRPVCGSNGQTYGNSCEAECQKVTWTEGSCQ